MSDDMVPTGAPSAKRMKPGRKANILKGLLALVVGVVLLTTLLPAAAQANGPSISIARINSQFVVQGHGFPSGTQGSVWAQLGSLSAQKDVWTQKDGSFTVTFYTFTSSHYGIAQAKAWIGGRYARNTTDMTKAASATNSGIKNQSVALNSANDGAPNTSAPTTPTTATPPTTVAPASTTTSKSTATTVKGSSTPVAASSTPATNIGAGTGFTDTPAGWKLAFSDDFTGTSLDRSKWGTYDGTGNQGIGTRSSAQDSVSNGEFHITGNGTVAGGMASNYKFTYGMVQIRARMDANSTGYNDALMLWPSSENWPVDGEVDMQEIYNGNTSLMSSFAHWGSNNSQSGHDTKGDFSQWHTISVDWEPGSLTYYVDGVEIWQVSGAAVPTTAHFIAMQLDVASDGGTHNSGSQLHVDWVKGYTH